MVEQTRISAAEYRALCASGSKFTSVSTKLAIKLPRMQKQKRDITPFAILSRITRRLNISKLTLKPEEALAVAFADALRAATMDGSLKAVWTHPANEIAGRHSGLSKIRYAIAKTMGLIDGTADYLFLWADGSGALEAKIGSNKMQDNQLDFQWWCETNGVRHAVFSTVEEGLAILRQWGALR